MGVTLSFQITQMTRLVIRAQLQPVIFTNPGQRGTSEEGRRGKDAGIYFSKTSDLIDQFVVQLRSHSGSSCFLWSGLLVPRLQLFSLAGRIVALVVVPGVLVAVAAVLWLLETYF